MLDRRRRINTDRDHRTVWRGGRVVRNLSVILRYMPSIKTETRFGFVVSSSVAKKAVDRNRIKRRLRAVAATASTPRPIDVVVYATKAATRATFAELQRDFLAALQATTHAPSPRRHN